MNITPENNNSFWIESTPETNFPILKENLNVEIAIVGAGIAGLTAAYLLTKAGKRVAVIEGDRIVKGASGKTTAKLTVLHQLIYADLIKEKSEKTAKIYAESNQAALEKVAEIIETENIDCDFSRCSAYTFALPTNDISKIEKEVDAAVKCGIPASFVSETPLPFSTKGAIKVDNQAQFHVRKYLLHLATEIVNKGGQIFEQTRVQNVEEDDSCKVISKHGVVTAEKVIITTKLPILDQGLFFAKTYPKRSYIIAAKIDPKDAPEGVFIGYGKDYHSIRTTPDGDDLLLLIGGQGHKVGEKSDTEECYQALESYAREHFPVTDIKYRWSSQDTVSFDSLPYFGKLTPMTKSIYVATGFSLWGMTNGTLSGMILSDLILGKDNPWAEIYDATRATPFVTQESLKKNLEVGINWVGDRLKSYPDEVDLQLGEGNIFTRDGDKVGVYKDEQGQLHQVSAVCSHLGCIVSWNNAEKSWDCPCHGARFDYEGRVLCGPATKSLEKK